MTIRFYIFLVAAWLALLGCVAFAGAPQLRTVLPQAVPPKSFTVTATLPAVIFMSPSLREPFSPLTGWSTNRWQVQATNEQAFFAAVSTNFPLTDMQVVVKWSTVVDAMCYCIYIGDGLTNWNQRVETYNRTQLTFKMFRCWQTNTFAMTSVNSNGVESVKSRVITLKPELILQINK